MEGGEEEVEEKGEGGEQRGEEGEIICTIGSPNDFIQDIYQSAN